MAHIPPFKSTRKVLVPRSQVHSACFGGGSSIEKPRFPDTKCFEPEALNPKPETLALKP